MLNVTDGWLTIKAVKMMLEMALYKAYKKKVFVWRNPTDPIYPADPTYFH